MQEPALDFIIFVVILGLVVTLSFGLIIPLVNESNNLVYSVKYDKTVEKAQGELINSDNDDCLTLEEIVLQVMGQSYFMPEPRKINLAVANAGDEIKILAAEGFSPDSKAIAIRAHKQITNWANSFASKGKCNLDSRLAMYGKQFTGGSIPSKADMRFKLQFDYNEPEKTSDDNYSLYIMLECKDIETGVITKETFKCMPDGSIRRR